MSKSTHGVPMRQKVPSIPNNTVATEIVKQKIIKIKTLPVVNNMHADKQKKGMVKYEVNEIENKTEN